MLEHGNLAAFCAWFNRFYEMNDKTKTAAYASFGQRDRRFRAAISTAPKKPLLLPFSKSKENSGA